MCCMPAVIHRASATPESSGQREREREREEKPLPRPVEDRVNATNGSREITFGAVKTDSTAGESRAITNDRRKRKENHARRMLRILRFTAVST